VKLRLREKAGGVGVLVAHRGGEFNCQGGRCVIYAGIRERKRAVARGSRLRRVAEKMGQLKARLLGQARSRKADYTERNAEEGGIASN